MNYKRLMLSSGAVLGLALASICYFFEPWQSHNQSLDTSDYRIQVNTQENLSLHSPQEPFFAEKSPVLTEQASKSSLSTKQGDVSLRFTSQTQELAEQKLEVIGTIPSWLQRGTLLRTGPALFEGKKGNAQRWFDGCAMLYKFTFDQNGCTYTNSFLRSNYFRQVKETGTFGMQKENKGGYFARLGSLITSDAKPTYDNGNSAVCLIGNQMCAITETPLLTSFDPVTLQNNSSCCFEDTLDAHYNCAHPLIDPETGDLYNYLIQFGKTSTYVIYTIKAGTKTRVPLAKISVGYPCYMHSFAMTKNYLILIEPPLRVNPIDFVMGDSSFFETYQWKPKQGTKITVIDKHTGDIVCTSSCESFFFMHQINAYEDKDTVVIDLASYENPDIVYSFDIGTLHKKLNPKNPAAFPAQCVVNIKTKKASFKKLASVNLEMPQINYGYAHTKPYTFVYGTHIPNNSSIATELIKLNVKNGHTLTWHEANMYPTEAVFVPRPGSKHEDDGVLLSVVLDTNTSSSFLLILDAKTMKEIARALIPHHIPLDSHGSFCAPLPS